MTIQSVGLQLYTVRDETARDFPLALRRVAEMGYKGVEFAGYGKVPSREMSALLADLGLQTFGSHVGLSLLEQNLNYEIEYCLDIGCPYIAIPTLPPQWRSRDGNGYRRLAAHLNAIGQRCHQQGISLVYHNHDFDFVQDEGQYLLDILLAETDPAYLQLELDSGWAAYSGVDTPSYLQRYAGRVPLIHLKDLTPERAFAEIGDGTLDIAAYYKAALASGIRYYLVENDTPRYPSLESVQRSLENLKKILSTNSEDLHVSGV